MINLVVALLSEARPLIDFFKLKQTKKAPYPLYEGEEMRLILSGIGKLNAACAVTTLQHARSTSQEECWLNIGLAGHPTLPIASTCLASKISDSSQRRVFYPTFLSNTPQKRAALMSLDQPSWDYLPDTLFDMEAFGFYFAAIQSASVERIHVYKIVSDNSKTSLQTITKTSAEQFIEQNLHPIDNWIQEMRKLTIRFPKHPEISLFLKKWHFSETEKHRLKNGLDILFCQDPSHASFESFKEAKNGKILLDLIKKRLQKLPLDRAPDSKPSQLPGPSL